MSRIGVIVCLFEFVSARAAAQPPDHSDHAEQMQHMGKTQEQFESREGSGTAWLPDETPMYAVHRTAGAWELMWHANVFVQFLGESSERSHDEAGSINWSMLMARRPAGGGRLELRGMTSLEPWTIRGCGYPDLLATGEVCNGRTIHDEQHPHDFIMEIAAEYDRPIAASLRWQLYGGLAGEPALGPAAFAHRPSAMPNPLAPIAHHWLDSTHITFASSRPACTDGAGKLKGRLSTVVSRMSGARMSTSPRSIHSQDVPGSCRHPASHCRSRPAISRKQN